MYRIVILSLMSVLFWAASGVAQQPVSMRVKAPELTTVTDWINSKPLKLADLKGSVVVLHFWTYG